MSNYGESYYLEELEEMQNEKVVRINPKKQIVIDKSDLDFIYKQIADLEAKLAEKEERINWLVEAEFNRKWAKKYVEMRRKEDPMLCLPDSDEVYEKYFELKQQLAEKDKELENYKLCKCVNCTNEYEFMLEGLVEDLERQIDKDNQDKINYAVEQLERVKAFVGKTRWLEKAEEVIEEYIDQLITEIKEGK